MKLLEYFTIVLVAGSMQCARAQVSRQGSGGLESLRCSNEERRILPAPIQPGIFNRLPP